MEDLNQQNKQKSGVFISNTAVLAFGFFVLILAFAAGFFAKGYFNFAVKSKGTDADVNVTPTPLATTKTPSDVYNLLPAISDADHIKGDKNAKTVLVVYSDLQCPYCAAFHTTVGQFLQGHSDVAFVFRHLPLDFHQFSKTRAEGLECVAKLSGEDKVWGYLDAVFASADLNNVDLDTIVATLGVNKADFDNCVKAAEVDAKITEQAAGGIKFLTALSDNGGYGTPGPVLVNRDKKVAVRLAGAVPLADLEAAYSQIK